MTDAPKKQPKPVIPAQAGTTATERIAELDMRRFKGGGYIIAPPAEMTRQSARVWLEQVAEAGSSGDVEIAWVKGVQDIYIKRELANVYEALKNAAGKRYYELEKQAAAEHEAQRTRKANRARSIAKLQADIAKLKAE
jgi:hypothetical protein